MSEERSWLGRGDRLVRLPTCGSTNDVAAAYARQGAPQGLVVVADTQTGGRGRLGRQWHSPPGENLYLSIVLRPSGTPMSLPPLTLLAGAVVAEVLRELPTPLVPRLKWPNDVLLDGPAGARKVCGILTEMASERDRVRHVVMGVGLNINQEAFPPELENRATSLRLQTDCQQDREDILGRLLDAFEATFDKLREAPVPAAFVLDQWRPFATLGARCRVEREGESVEGIAVDVDLDGALKLRDDSGLIHRVLSGEIV